MTNLDQAAEILRMMSIGHPWETDQKQVRRERAKEHYWQACSGISLYIWKELFGHVMNYEEMFK